MVTVGDTKWPIEIEVTPDKWVRTKGQTQTLGADNGLGVAMAMAACDGMHGPLELLFTSDEEDDFTGCQKFNRKFFGMQSRLLVNLDTPHDGRITVASAGFLYLINRIRLERQEPHMLGKTYKLSLSGMPAGHSGEDVHMFRGNALKTMGLLLSRLPEGSRIVSLTGGEKGNSIPGGATCVVEMLPGREAGFEVLEGLVAFARETYRCPQIRFTTEEVKDQPNPLSRRCHNDIVNLLRTVPNGVVRMSLDLEDLPELSSTPSLAVMEDGDILMVKHQIRGATEPLIDEMKDRLTEHYTTNGFTAELGHRGRSWIQDVDHPLVKATQAAFEQTGYPGMLSGNHGAIEPGTLCGDPSNPQFDAAVSFGCWIRDEHKETERFYIPSLARTYKALAWLLIQGV
jgi:dipeptidase D